MQDYSELAASRDRDPSTKFASAATPTPSDVSGPFQNRVWTRRRHRTDARSGRHLGRLRDRALPTQATS